MDFFKFLNIVRYQNFDKSFYDYLPYGESGVIEDTVFLKISNELKNPSAALTMFSNSTLPQTKSIKKVFMKCPYMLFYINECEKLYNIIDNINLFRKVVSCDSCFIIFSFLHTYSGIYTFLEDYCLVEGKIKLTNHLLDDFNQIVEAALKYVSLSNYGRAYEQKKWKKDKNYFSLKYFMDVNVESYNTPMSNPPENIVDINIDGYSFKWLRTSSEYKKAGDILNNCLKEWNVFNNPVTAIYKSNNIIAAVEVNKNEVFQAYKKDNKMIIEDKKLYNAFLKWTEKYNLKISIPDIT